MNTLNRIGNNMKILILFIFFLIKDTWTVFYKEIVPMITLSTESKSKRYNEYHLYIYKLIEKDTVYNTIKVDKKLYLKYKLNSKISL